MELGVFGLLTTILFVVIVAIILMLISIIVVSFPLELKLLVEVL